MSKYDRLTIRNSDGSVSQPTHSTFEKVFNRLAELEDKIEQGTLIELPCKVGDIVYQFDNGGKIYEAMILDIAIYKGKPYYETCGVDFDNRAIGESVFLTKAEAEAKLKELNNE